MSVYEKIDEMCTRLTESESSQRIAGRIGLYSSGVKEKLRNAD